MSVDGMDSIFSIALGLGLRLILSAASGHNMRVAGTLVGLWEGAVLYHFIEKFPRSPDPYVGLAVRLFVDFIATASFVRLAIVVLWTFLGVVIADVTPAFWYDRHLRRFVRRTRRYIRNINWSLFSAPWPWISTIPSHVRFFHVPPSTRSNPDPRPVPVSPAVISQTPTVTRIPGVPQRLAPVISETSTTASTGSVSVRSPIPAQSLPSAMRRSGSSKSSSVSFELDEERSRQNPSYTAAIDDPAPVELRPPTISPISIPIPMPPPAAVDTTTPFAIPMSMPEPSVPLPSVDELPEIPPISAAPLDDSPPPPFSRLDPLPLVDGLPHARVRPPRAEKASFDGASVISGGSRDSIIRRADILRQEAVAEEKERDRLKVERQRALEECRYTDAVRLKVEEQEAHERSVNLHRRAADRYFKAHNLDPDPYTIDVHRLRVREALRQTEIAIRDTLISGGLHLRVIVGRGNHSQNKLPALKLALMAELQAHHLSADVDSANPGILIVNLPDA